MIKGKNKEKIKKKDPRKWWKLLIYFFPVQLLFVHLKKNQQLLIFWIFLFLSLFHQFGEKYGIPYLFLAPEYLGEVSIWSYAIFGFSFGGFVMAFNIASYIINGFRFPFLATLAKPFMKYCVNNATIPIAYIISFVILSARFLLENEGISRTEIIQCELGFLGGYGLFIILSLTYFMMTNKDFEKLFGKEIGKVISSDSEGDEPARILLQKKEKAWFNDKKDRKSWRVESYIGSAFRLKRTRPYGHYDRQMLSQVFRQNHINASFFEIVVILSILTLGFFRDNELFIIPAAATFFLLITMLLMAVSALRSWIRGWTFVALAVLFVFLNYLSKYDDFYYVNYLYGLDYNSKVDYPPAKLTESEALQHSQNDLEINQEMLENWKSKNEQHSHKPKAIFISLSGGGSRAALWSFLSLQHLDSLTNGRLMDQSIMMTGSSGGMIGASYYRELRSQFDRGMIEDPTHSDYRWDMGKDLLNPLIFNMVVNDLFLKTKKVEIDGKSHWKDRGYIFEKTLNEMSRGKMNKRFGDYREDEYQANVPFMVFSPSIVNDSRRMLISNLPLSFMSNVPIGHQKREENIEFMDLFQDHKADSIHFISVLRMNATFPYVMPIVDMPTNPGIELFDSGLRDNYGIKTTVKYIYHLRDWLQKNTSGIVILQLRNSTMELGDQKIEKRSIARDLSSPFGSLYGNLFQVQEFNNEELLEYTRGWYGGPVDLLSFELYKDEQQKISLSWHLTSKEKEMVLISLFTNQNQRSAARLQQILN